MQVWLRSWLVAAVLLAALGGGADPAAGSVVLPPDGPDAGAGSGAVPEPRSEARPAPNTLSLARPLDSSFSAASLELAEPLAFSFGRRGARLPRAAGAPGAARAQILLRSLTVPGWGQATLGRRRSAAFFGLTETAIWGAFAAFRIQVAMREDAFRRTAQLQAGIDLDGRGEEWLGIVGGFSSSDEYNRLVVARDAANLYLSDPEAPQYAAYYAYIDEHSLKGGDTWAWSGDGQHLYLDQRRDAVRASQRANTMLAAALVNRIVSALHAARAAGRPATAARSWQFEAVPVPSRDAMAFQLRVRARF